MSPLGPRVLDIGWATAEAHGQRPLTDVVIAIALAFASSQGAMGGSAPSAFWAPLYLHNRDSESALRSSSPAGSPGHPGRGDENAEVIGMSHITSNE